MGQFTSVAVAESYKALLVINGTIANCPLSNDVCASGDNQSTFLILSVLDGSGPRVMVLSCSVTLAPLNMATKVQKFTAFSARTEKGTIWQQEPTSLPVMTHVECSRAAQAVLTYPKREALDTLDPPPLLALSPAWAMKALIPAPITATSPRI